MIRLSFPLLVSLISGILAGHFYDIPTSGILVLFVLLLPVLIVSLIRKLNVPLLFSLLLILFFSGILNINLYRNPHLDTEHIVFQACPETVLLDGEIVSCPESSPHKTTMVLEAYTVIRNRTQFKVTGKVWLSLKIAETSLEYGDFIRVRTRLVKPQNFNNPGRFDYVRHLLYRRILVTASVWKPSDIMVIRKNRGNAFLTHLYRYRDTFKKLIIQNTPPVEGNILRALLLGERKAIPEDVLEKFNRTGISHILAISGLHIGIIAFLSFLAVNATLKTSTYLLLRFNSMKTAAFCAIIPITGYAFLAGMQISTIRATIMILAFLIALLLNRIQNLLNTVTFTALILLLADPTALFEISFQLSFAAVSSIIILMPLFPSPQDLPPSPDKRRSVFTGKRLLSFFISLLFVSLSAVIGTAPLIALYFNRLSPAGFIANLIVIPIIGFIVLPLELIALLVSFFAVTPAIILLKVAAFFVSFTLVFVDAFASLPFASFMVTTPSVPEILIYYVILLIGIRFPLRGLLPQDFSSKPGTRIVFIIFLLTFFSISNSCFHHIKRNSVKDMKVTFLDVGKGNATVLQCPSGKTILIDGGGFSNSDFDVGKFILAPYLWREHLQEIDLVVLSHPHQDHVGGLPYILENFQVKQVWYNGEKAPLISYLKFLSLIEEKHIPLTIVSSGTPKIRIAGVGIKILHPPPFKEEKFTTNDNSLVIKIDFKEVSFLLPADITALAEDFLIRQNFDLNSTVLSAPHHGGSTSGTAVFLQKVQPLLTVFSCRTNNNRTFPSPAVVARYSAVGSRILRTDIHGAVTVHTDGSDFRFSCYNEKEVFEK